MNDPKDDLKRMTSTDRIPLLPQSIDAMSTADAAILLAIKQTHKAADALWDEMRGVKDHLVTQDSLAVTQAATLNRVEQKVDHTNGTVREHAADIELLKQKESERAKIEYEGVLIERTKQAALQGVWVIPKLSWRTITVIAGIITFLGYDKLINILWFLISLLPRHP